MSRALHRIRIGTAAVLALGLAACSADSPITAPESAVLASVAADGSAGPTLLYCPTSDTRSVSRRIGPDGGSVTLAGTRLVVPAGAVAVETEFVLTIPASDWLELDIDAAGHDHYRFAEPVTVTVNYARCGSDAAESEALTAWHVDEDTGELLENMGAVDLKTRRKLTFETDHLSKYAIAF